MRAVVLAVWLAGCTVAEGDPVPTPALDVADYAAHVDPIVRFSCASLDCHGDEGRPLRIYAEDGLRIDASLRGEPLSAEEAAWDAAAFAGIDPEPVSLDDHLALTKPLAVEAGGLAHVGGDVWPDREDPSYVCVRAWLANEGMGSDAIAACDLAAAALDPYP